MQGDPSRLVRSQITQGLTGEERPLRVGELSEGLKQGSDLVRSASSEIVLMLFEDQSCWRAAQLVSWLLVWPR